MTKHYFTIGNKRYEYSLLVKGNNQDNEHITHVFCSAAGVDQDFLSEDVPALLADLPNFVEEQVTYDKQQKNAVIRFRTTVSEKRFIENRAAKDGFANVSDYLRKVALAV